MARKMKDSGIEWIGEIPEGWEVSQLKYVTRWKSEKGCPDAPVLSLYRDFGVVPKDSRNDNHNVTSLDTSNYKVVDIGDLVINKMKAWQGSMAVSDYRGIVSPAYHVCSITSNKVNKRYLHHLLRNPAYLPEYARLSTGMRIGQWDLGFDDFKNIPFLIPPLDEQAKIADYLDNGCASLDAMLSKTRSSIEEYKKLKQAVITQAVTKGVRGEREMKDSGVEWIGKIPREFDPVQLKFFCKLITDGTHFSPTTVENGWPYITAGDVHGIGLDYNSAKRISEEDFQLLVAQGCQPLKGDVLLVKDGATTGRVGFVDSDTPCVILSSVAMLRPADNTDGHYLMYLLASDFLQKQILVSMAGSAMPRTTLTKLTKYIGLLSPLHEQKEIANYLDAKCAEIDKLIAKKEQLIKELESYKKSLIYEVVTGKREV